MENSYHIRMSLFPNLNSDRHSDSVIPFRMNNLRTESRCFSPRKGQTTQKFFIVNEIRRTAKKIRSCIVLKESIAKNFVANEHHSFTFVFTFSVVVVHYRPTTS